MRIAVIICTFFSLFAVAKADQQPKRHYTLSQVRKILPGKSKKADVLSLIGQPKERWDLSKTGPTKLQGEGWSYFEAPISREDRVTIDFAPNSDVVRAVGWDVREGEHERSLDEARKLFPKADFEKQKMPDLNPHEAEMRYFYKEKKLGVILIYDSSHGHVDEIRWMMPSEVEKRTAPENFIYSEVCVQSHCAHSSLEIERVLLKEEAAEKGTAKRPDP